MRTANSSRPLADGHPSLQPSTLQAVLESLPLRRTHACGYVPLNPGRVWVKALPRISAHSSRPHGARGPHLQVSQSAVTIRIPAQAMLLVEVDHAHSFSKWREARSSVDSTPALAASRITVGD